MTTAPVPTQADLDLWFGVTPAERAELRTGLLPARFQRAFSPARWLRALFGRPGTRALPLPQSEVVSLRLAPRDGRAAPRLVTEDGRELRILFLATGADGLRLEGRYRVYTLDFSKPGGATVGLLAIALELTEQSPGPVESGR